MDGSSDASESVDYNCLLPTIADRSLGNCQFESHIPLILSWVVLPKVCVFTLVHYKMSVIRK